MQEKETMDFIYDFVEKRGGVENFVRELELQRTGGPPTPPSGGKSKMIKSSYLI